MMKSMAAYRELVAKIDSLVRRIRDRYGMHIECRKGCAECCTPAFKVFPVEAWAVKEALHRVPRSHQEVLLSKARNPMGESCLALEDGSCLIYPLRPVLCRTHGFPLLIQAEQGGPEVLFCKRNFSGQGLKKITIAGDCVIHLENLNFAVTAINSLFTKEWMDRGLGDLPCRVDILHFLAIPSERTDSPHEAFEESTCALRNRRPITGERSRPRCWENFNDEDVDKPMS